MNDAVDVAASLTLVSGLTVALGVHVASSAVAGRLLVEERVEREAGLPVVGRAPMHAVYRALRPLARGLVACGVTANAVTLASLGLAAVAAAAFAMGHFGLGAFIACVASLADAVDGLVARASGASSRLGQILDTTVDRYVDALLLGGIAIYVRESVILLALSFAALVGSFMTSYASSLERELRGAASPSPMRRAHRLAYLIGGSALGSIFAGAFGAEAPRAGLVPVVFALGAIAVIGNVSAVRRVLAAGRGAVVPPAPSSSEDAACAAPAPRSASR